MREACSKATGLEGTGQKHRRQVGPLPPNDPSTARTSAIYQAFTKSTVGVSGLSSACQ